MRDISLDKAEILSALMEGTLYGFSLLMFCGTIWAVLTRRSADRVKCTMITVACLFLLLSTTHFVIGIIRLVEGFVSYRDTYPGGPDAFFADTSQWTFVFANFVYTAQTLLADGVVLYRCYVVWQSKCVMILPVLLWCAVAVTGIESSYTTGQMRQREAFDWPLTEWIMSFWLSALATDLVTTLLLAGRIWYVDRKAKRHRSQGKSHLSRILHIVIDAGLAYSTALVVQLICFLRQSNFQYVLLSMITPIISITFYMVIIRVDLANRSKQTIIRALMGSQAEEDNTLQMAPVDGESYQGESTLVCAGMAV